MIKETKAMILIMFMIATLLVCIEYLNELTSFKSLGVSMRILIAAGVGGCVGLVYEVLAYLLDKYVKIQKDDTPISFWKYILKLHQSQEGKWRRVIAVVLVAGCITTMSVLGVFSTIHLATRIILAAIIGVCIGLLIEYISRIIKQQKSLKT